MPLPTMDIMANKWRGKKVEKQFDNVVNELKSKKNFLIYPSGRLKQTGMELIGGASFVHRLLQACPEVNIVLIRTTGLWGSQFSRALTGASPDFGKSVWECAKILIKNGIFFTPKREVVVELEMAPADFPYQGTRFEFNKYLENWYNRYQGQKSEPLTLVSYAFWKEELPNVYVFNVASAQPVEERPVAKKIQQEVFSHLTSLCGRESDLIERKMHLSHDLGLDSLDIAQLYVFLDERVWGGLICCQGDLHTVEDVLQKQQKVIKNCEMRQHLHCPNIHSFGQKRNGLFLRSPLERRSRRSFCKVWHATVLASPVMIQYLDRSVTVR